MPIKLNSTGGGSVSIDVPSTASTYTLTAPAKTANLVTDSANSITQSMLSSNVVGNGPAFSAYGLLDVTMTTAGTYYKSSWSVSGNQAFDTHSYLDLVNNRYLPLVAGYYYFAASTNFSGASGGYLILGIYKNGTMIRNVRTPGNTNYPGVHVSVACYMNGSTDYVEVYGSSSVTNNVTMTNNSDRSFTGFMIRSA